MRAFPLLAPLLLVIASSVGAHHRQTAEISQITVGGDSAVPRTMSLGRFFVVAAGNTGAHTVNRVRRINMLTGFVPTPIGGPGDDANPAIARDGRTIVWDTPPGVGTGRHIKVIPKDGLPLQVTSHPTGSCINPAIDGKAKGIAFECNFDAASTGTSAVWRIIRWDGASLTQVSTGRGASRNVTFADNTSALAYDSTDDPTDGHDTGVSQIWLHDLRLGTVQQLTNGSGHSTRPTMSDKARLVAFESRADLAGDGHDTGLPQIFAYDRKSATMVRITNDPSGCTSPSVIKAGTEWYVSYICDHDAQVYELRYDRHWHLPTVPGSTDGASFLYSKHFLMLSTTADLLNPGQVTAGHQIFVWNMWKRPGEPLPATALWFPSRGLGN